MSRGRESGNGRGDPRSTGVVTIREVARLAGVHPGTASRALNAATRGLVNEQTARRVEQAARQLEYRPNHSARSLKTRRSDTIGVLIPDLTNPLFPPIVRGVEDRLAQAGYVALIGNTDNDEDRERLVFERMAARHVDGFILATAHRAQALPTQRAAAPVVLVNRVSQDGSVPSVSVDDRAGMRMAVRHLVELGHRRIGHVAGPQNLSTGHGRYQGFLDGMREAGLDVDDDLVAFCGYFSEGEGFRAGAALLAAGVCTAIVAANDSLALGVLLAAEAAGVHCPGEVSVTGFNDVAFVDRVRPSLTTVRVPQYQLGYQAAHLVLEQVSGGEAATAKAVLLRVELVVRDSTGPVRAAAARPSSRRRGGGAGR